MIVQSAPVILKQRNQVNRECLYAWYPEVVIDSETTKPMGPRDIYIHKGIDKDLIQQDSHKNRLINNNNSNNNNEVIRRYTQSMAPSEPIYHSADTLDEALTTPWALHYEVKRTPATPNPPSHSTETTREEIPRRLKSAPVARSQPLTSILTIPEPRFVTPIIPVTTTELPRTPKPKHRASSARARLNTTLPIYYEQTDATIKQQRREIKSAQVIRQNDETRLSDEEYQTGSNQMDSETTQQPLLFVSATPTILYPRPTSASSNELPSTSIDKKTVRTKIEINPIPLNPHYIHRPGVIAASNTYKMPIVRESSASRKMNRSSHRRHHHHNYRHRDKQHEPLLALTPMLQPTKLPVEIDGIKLIYDPTLAIDDASLNLTKYFIEGRLYLIKDQHYNVLENIDPKAIEKYNQNSNLAQRTKYYQTIPIEKFQIPKPPQEVHYNASETYFYNTIPKRVHRYVVDPNFISENLNISGRSMSKQTAPAATTTATTTTVVQPTINDINRQQATPTTVYS
ncbi:unnamed protein product [Rotaria socialis]|uniref:Uncharacterized protein n=3 Tax=Rotaria socialis TaxID=392032 RepID=A0A817Z5I3_9BILA|nr:unnamed protein product [Rotaria socialis]